MGYTNTEKVLIANLKVSLSGYPLPYFYLLNLATTILPLSLHASPPNSNPEAISRVPTVQAQANFFKKPQIRVT